MNFPSKLVTIAWIFCALALPTPLFAAPESKDKSAVSAKVADLEKQIDALATVEQKIAFLNDLKGQEGDTTAQLGAYIISSAPVENQKDVAGQVATALATASGNTPNTAKLMGQLSKDLPPDVASLVASSVAVAAAKAVPEQAPGITAAVIVAQPSTITNAATIAAAVTTAAPLDMASKIATAIGQEYTAHPDLVAQAPQIATEMTNILLGKGNDTQIKTEIGQSVAILTASLPDFTGKNKDTALNISSAVAAVVNNHPEVGAAIVLYTAEGMQQASPAENGTPASTAPVKTTALQFADSFLNQMTDQTLKDNLSNGLTDVLSGKSTANNINAALNSVSSPGQVSGNQNSNTGDITYGQINKTETPVQ